MLQGDAASPIRPPCTDSSRLTETRGVRNHPDPVNGASGPAPSNAPQPSTAAASSCAATGARRLEAFRAHEDTRRQRLPTVRAGVRRSSRLTAGRAPGRLIEEEPPDDAATARQQIPVESPAARLRRMVYEVYLRHGEVVLPRVVRAEIPGIVVNASGRSYPLEQAIIAARNQWRAEGRPLPRSSYTTCPCVNGWTGLSARWPCLERSARHGMPGERRARLLCMPSGLISRRASRRSSTPTSRSIRRAHTTGTMFISGSEIGARNIPVSRQHDGTTPSCLATSAMVDGRRRPIFAIGSTSSRASGNRSNEPSPFRGGAPRALRFGRNG